MKVRVHRRGRTRRAVVAMFPTAAGVSAPAPLGYGLNYGQNYGES
jgi:hypothetical protein